MNNVQGMVLWGANNIFSIRLDSSPEQECFARFKGKKLHGVADEHNALVPGDRVGVVLEGGSPLIVTREKRTNAMVRWNKKNRSAQAFAANIDLCAIVTSPVSPPFRPRFIDRCLATADFQGIPSLIIMNKSDQGLDEDVLARIMLYQKLGYQLSIISVQEERGLEELLVHLKGKTTLFMGQSGVGKSSLLKSLFPTAVAKVGELSEKFNRGKHTTVLAKTYAVPGVGDIIDSPGVREFEPAGIPAQALGHLYKDMVELLPQCGRYNCTHTVEDDCAVAAAAMEGLIDADRYESYLRLYEVLAAQEDRPWE